MKQSRFVKIRRICYTAEENCKQVRIEEVYVS